MINFGFAFAGGCGGFGVSEGLYVGVCLYAGVCVFVSEFVLLYIRAGQVVYTLPVVPLLSRQFSGGFSFYFLL